jgi:hypothetical protein
MQMVREKSSYVLGFSTAEHITGRAWGSVVVKALCY